MPPQRAAYWVGWLYNKDPPVRPKVTRHLTQLILQASNPHSAAKMANERVMNLHLGYVV